MPHISVCWPSWGRLRHSPEHPSLHSGCTTVRHKGFKWAEAQFERAEQSCGTSREPDVRAPPASPPQQSPVARCPRRALAATRAEAALAVWRAAASGLTHIPFSLPARSCLSPPGIASVNVTLEDRSQNCGPAPADDTRQDM